MKHYVDSIYRNQYQLHPYCMTRTLYGKDRKGFVIGIYDNDYCLFRICANDIAHSILMEI